MKTDDTDVRLERRAAKEKTRKSAEWKDLRVGLELAALTPASWLAPEALLRPISRCWEAMFVGHAARLKAGRAPAFRSVLGDELEPDEISRMSLGVSATRTEHHMQILREWRPGGWRPNLRFEGEEHVRDALGKGNGAVLWVAHFSFNALATKIAFHRAGLPFHHLSRAEHGFSKTALGIRFLNPIRVKAELKYLRGRVIIEPSRPARAMLAAKRLLSENELVSITAGHWEGATIAGARIGSGAYPLATGAPALSALTGAPLLPVFTARAPGSKLIKVSVEKPIEIPADLSKEDSLRLAVDAFADRLIDQIGQYPEQWRGWSALTLDP